MVKSCHLNLPSSHSFPLACECHYFGAGVTLSTALLRPHTTQNNLNLLELLLDFPTPSSPHGVRDLENRFQIIPMEMYHAAIITKCYESCKLLRLVVGKQCLENVFPSFSDNT